MAEPLVYEGVVAVAVKKVDAMTYKEYPQDTMAAVHRGPRTGSDSFMDGGI